MGKRVTVTLFDDLEPELEATEHLSFAFEGANYEIDLGTKNANRLRKEMATWISVATRTAAPTRKRATTATTGTKNTYSGGEAGLPLAEIRKWAIANGHTVSDRGRVSAEIVRAWKAAHEKPAKPDAPEFSAK